MSSQKVRDIIDSIEKHGQNKAELEHLVTILRNEILSLNLAINDLRSELKNLKELGDFSDHLPNDISMFKKMIKTQREELNENDRQVEVSKILVEKLTNDLENTILNKESEYNLSDIPGIDPKIEEKLRRIGISTVYDLMNAKVEKISL